MQDQYRCPFCYEKFDVKKHVPKFIIKCGHNMCEVCLISFMEKAKNLNCPIDGKILEFKKIQIQMYPDNIQLINDIESQNNQSPNPQNDQGTKKINMLNIPSQNEDDILSSSQSQNNIKNTIQIDLQSHTKTGNSSQSLQKVNLFCDEHQKNCELICIDCEMRCCYKCAVFNKHKGHNIKEIEEFQNNIQDYKNNIQSISKQIQNKEEFLQNQIIDFQFNPKIQKKLKFIQNKIVLDFDRAVQTLLNEKKNILKKLEQQKEERKQQVKNFVHKEIQKIQDKNKDLKLKTQTLINNLGEKDEKKKIKLFKNYTQNTYLKDLKTLKKQLKIKQQSLKNCFEIFFEDIEKQYVFEFKPQIKSFNFPQLNFHDDKIQSQDDILNCTSVLSLGKVDDNQIQLKKESIKDDELLTDIQLNINDEEIEKMSTSFNQDKIFRAKKYKLAKSNNQSFVDFSEIRSKIFNNSRQIKGSHKRINSSFDIGNKAYGSFRGSRKKLQPSITKISSFLEYANQQQNNKEPILKQRSSILSSINPSAEEKYNINIKNKIDNCKRQGSSILNLKNMKLNENDIQIMQNAIRFNKKILTLDLSFNELNYKAIQNLCSYLENSSIVKLNLSNNKLSQRALNPLLHLVKINKSIKEINFSNNKVSKKNIEKAMNLFSKEYIKIIL